VEWIHVAQDRVQWKVLRRIFGTKKEEETAGWRKLHNKELHTFYSSPHIIRMRWMEHEALWGIKKCRQL
jgi:hypothetical protein